ncbi:hypothetical protein Zm00014a_014886 [Zea mays]|uniref:CDP-diacylglycerol--serine O-phosphatidyltransferase n=1 Tax=Zea mays TaxID=4577 RepID=A0A3L6F1L3_MAIZE|nr:hypothetical protein Zm00014a_014886 [Zea mays]
MCLLQDSAPYIPVFAMLHHQSFILYPFPAPINRSSALLMIHSHFSSHKSTVLIQCSWQFCHRILITPHPAVWHLVHGLAVVYLIALTFLLFQNRDDARQFMKLLHPDLGVELLERSYGADCRFYVLENPKNKFINIYETLFDEYVVAHILGWFGKAVMIRNQLLLWVLSIGFELMETYVAKL